jgi:hypothetical protein
MNLLGLFFKAAYETVGKHKRKPLKLSVQMLFENRN